MKKGVVALLAVVALAASLSAQGPTVVEKVNFAFTVGKVDLPAGDYIFERNGELLFHVHSLDLKAEPQALVSATTRLATTPGKQAMAVFDHIGDKYVLSEIWLPAEDGYLVSSATAKHTHAVVTGK